MRLTVLTASIVLVYSGTWALAEEPKPKDSTLGLKAPEGAKVLFNGKDLTGWVKPNGKDAEWLVQDGLLIVNPRKGAIQTTEPFGDFQLHIEFNVPYMPDQTGQARGNSGVYLGGIYELQVLDSYGLKLQNNDCGAIYKQIIPKVNACKPPLQWQTYDVTFHKAVVEGDKVVKKARVTVVHNGIKTIDDAEIDVCPAGASNKEGEPGPLFLQDHGNPVHFRNIWLKPLS